MKRLLSALLVLLVAATCAYAHDSSVSDIDLKALKAAIHNKTVVLLDCNGTASYNKGHLPGAINFDANKNNLAKVLPPQKDRLIVAYCGGPKCMLYKNGAAAVTALGYTNVKHWVGGLKGWVEAKLPLETGSNN